MAPSAHHSGCPPQRCPLNRRKRTSESRTVMSALGHNQNAPECAYSITAYAPATSSGDISIPSSLAAEIDNKFKLRCLKVRYSPKASARTEAGRFGRERIQRGRQAHWLCLFARTSSVSRTHRCLTQSSSAPINGGDFRRTTPWFASRLRPAFSVSCARARVKGQGEGPNWPCALLRPACPIEFGTGFLPPETGAPKGA